VRIFAGAFFAFCRNGLMNLSSDQRIIAQLTCKWTEREEGMSVQEESRSRFNAGYNCAESVLLVLSKQPELTRWGGGSFIPRIATGFGGGVARNGNVCGALAAGVMAISLVLGRDGPEEPRDPCYCAVDQFYNEFVREFGTWSCRELTRTDLKDREGRERYLDRIHNERCSPIVAWAAKRVYQIIRDKP